jgi:hypothetical protein
MKDYLKCFKCKNSALRSQIGSLDNELQGIIEQILTLSPAEFTPLLMQLSREELIARFSRQS